MYTITPANGAQLLSSEEIEAVGDAVFTWMEVQREVLGELGESPVEPQAVGEVQGQEEEVAHDVGIDPFSEGDNEAADAQGEP
jgi:hypothetical protein